MKASVGQSYSTAVPPVDQSEVSLAERRARLESARDALAGIDAVLPQGSGAGLGELLRLADEVAMRAAAMRVLVCAEAVRQGRPFEESLDVHGWVREHAPGLRQGGARQVAQLASAAASAAASGGLETESAEPVGSRLDEESPLGRTWSRVGTGEVGVPLASVVLREVERIRARLDPDALPVVSDTMTDLGVQLGPAAAAKLRPALLAKYGAEGEADALEERLAPSAFLSRPSVRDADLTEYRMALTPEQAATLEAAIDDLSRPVPHDETGERDRRPPAQRRAEALIEVVRHGVRADVDRSDRHSAEGAAGSSMALHVSMHLRDLLDLLRGDQGRVEGRGTVLGTTAEGTMLAPATVRRLCCDADLIPAVLGSEGEVLDLGRVVRLFTRGQRRLLVQRDGGCTFPTCDAPSSWTRAHHAVHWWDGGPTDIGNAALLCERHHTIVHSRRLSAEIRETPDELGRFVVWDLTRGSYDAAVRRLAQPA